LNREEQGLKRNRGMNEVEEGFKEKGLEKVERFEKTKTS
jgi:hypothetical protein